MRKQLQPHEKRFAKSLLLVLVIFLLPFIYGQPEYDQLETKEITIERTYYSTGRKSIGTFIRSADGRRYKVTGTLPSRAVFEEMLSPGTRVQIRTYRGIHICLPMNFVEELNVNGEIVIPYRDRQSVLRKVCAAAGWLILLLSVLNYVSASHLFRKLRKKTENRKR